MYKEKDFLENGYEDFVVFENPSYDGCIVGMSTDNRLIYSLNSMIEYLVKNDEMDYEEAAEFIDYNTIRSLDYIENSPIILDDLSMEIS